MSQIESNGQVEDLLSSGQLDIDVLLGHQV